MAFLGWHGTKVLLTVVVSTAVPAIHILGSASRKRQERYCTSEMICGLSSTLAVAIQDKLIPV